MTVNEQIKDLRARARKRMSEADRWEIEGDYAQALALLDMARVDMADLVMLTQKPEKESK